MQAFSIRNGEASVATVRRQRLGYMPFSLNGKSSWLTMMPTTPFCPCRELNLSPSSGRRVVRISTCRHVMMHARACTHVMHACTSTCTIVYTYSTTVAYTQTHTHSRAYGCMHACTHGCARTRLRTLMRKCSSWFDVSSTLSMYVSPTRPHWPAIDRTSPGPLCVDGDGLYACICMSRHQHICMHALKAHTCVCAHTAHA